MKMRTEVQELVLAPVAAVGVGGAYRYYVSRPLPPYPQAQEVRPQVQLLLRAIQLLPGQRAPMLV